MEASVAGCRRRLVPEQETAGKPEGCGTVVRFLFLGKAAGSAGGAITSVEAAFEAVFGRLAVRCTIGDLACLHFIFRACSRFLVEAGTSSSADDDSHPSNDSSPSSDDGHSSLNDELPEAMADGETIRLSLLSRYRWLIYEPKGT